MEAKNVYNIEAEILAEAPAMMASPSTEQAKKRKSVPKYHDFRTFADPDYFDTVSFSGAFEDNVRVFVERFVEELVDRGLDGESIWHTFLVYDGGEFLIPLYIVGKNGEFPVEPLCDHCKCAGLKYHVIIPVDEEWKKPFTLDVSDHGTHLLHGVFHSNGIGHLLRINGREGGSKRLCGIEIMDLWDRICSFLRARKITVQDVSKKRGMDLRLLHGIAYGQPWFGKWGYQLLCAESGKALQSLSSMELDQVIQNFSSNDVKNLIFCYREASKTNLITLRDLLAFMLTLKFRPEGRQDVREFSTIARTRNSRWPVDKQEHTANVVVEALKMNREKKTLMTRQQVRDAARKKVGTTGLIDYVLKSLDNVVVGDYIVTRTVNKDTRILEFMIKEFKKDGSKNVLDIWTDVFYMYNNVTLESNMAKGLGKMVLNNMYLVKEWPFGDDSAYPNNDQSFKCVCECYVAFHMPIVGNAEDADSLIGLRDDDVKEVQEDIHTKDDTDVINVPTVPARPNLSIAETQSPIVGIRGEDPYVQMKNFAEDVCIKHKLDVYFKASIPKGVLGSEVVEIKVGIKDLWEWLQPNGWIFGEHLVIWSRYLYEQMTEEDKNRVQLVDPSLTYTHGERAKDQQIDGIAQKLVDMVANKAKLYIVPYTLRSHWLLLVFRPEVKMVYKFDSLQLNRSRDVETFTRRVANKWYLLNEEVQSCAPRDYKWNLVPMEHKLQLSGWECGYYIMIWMEQIALQVPHLDLKTRFPQDKSAYDGEEVLHDLIVRWCGYVIQTFLPDWIAQAHNFIKRKSM